MDSHNSDGDEEGPTVYLGIHGYIGCPEVVKTQLMKTA